MATVRRARFVRAQVAWMLSTICILVLAQSLTVESFVGVSLVGLLLVAELTAPLTVTPRWRARLKWVIAAALLGFGYIVIRRVLAILPSGL